ncbi:MAG: hypothetical protein ACJATI_003331 [Halioglobus sp.]|jgi:hypothetical protein
MKAITIILLIILPSITISQAISEPEYETYKHGKVYSEDEYYQKNKAIYEAFLVEVDQIYQLLKNSGKVDPDSLDSFIYYLDKDINIYREPIITFQYKEIYKLIDFDYIKSLSEKGSKSKFLMTLVEGSYQSWKKNIFLNHYDNLKKSSKKSIKRTVKFLNPKRNSKILYNNWLIKYVDEQFKNQNIYRAATNVKTFEKMRWSNFFYADRHSQNNNTFFFYNPKNKDQFVNFFDYLVIEGNLYSEERCRKIFKEQYGMMKYKGEMVVRFTEINFDGEKREKYIKKLTKSNSPKLIYIMEQEVRKEEVVIKMAKEIGFSFVEKKLCGELYLFKFQKE